MDWTDSSAVRPRAAGRIAAFLILAAVVAGCQGAPATVSNRTLLAHLPGVNFTGLLPMQTVDVVQVNLSLPEHWKGKYRANPLYVNHQWKAPSGYTGIGVIHVNLPFEISAQSLLWLAKMEYSKSEEDGKALAQWTDELGRPWFEAENDKYHVRGYAVTNGLNAWIVYYGYKTTRPTNVAELNLAARCIQTVVPQLSAPPKPKPAMAEITKSGDKKG